MGLVSELRRRNVLRMVVLYAVAAWLIMQVAEVLIDLAKLPDWIGQIVLALLAIGFPIALLFSWFYELTPEGLSLEKDIDPADSIAHITGRRIDFVVISLLSAAVILFAWHTWWPSAPMDKSIAVMAFENMSDDPDQEYFSDGISEELLNTLAQIPELRVISRSSSFSFKGKGVDTPTVAKQLNVTHVLEGSVRKMGDRVRITAQLIEASTDSHLWSETYDRELDDIFAIQNEISAAIVGALKKQFHLNVLGAPLAIDAEGTEAHEAYLMGRYLVVQRTRASVEGAVREFKKAISLDPEYASAYAELAIAISLQNETNYGDLTFAEASTKAAPYADRAVALSPKLAAAHAASGFVSHVRGNAEAALAHYEDALQINPNYSIVYLWMANLRSREFGQYKEAFDLFEIAVRLDPLSLPTRMTYFYRLLVMGRFEDAELQLEKLAQLSPGFAQQAKIYLLPPEQLAEKALASLDALQSDPEDARFRAGLGFALTVLGLEIDALSVSEDPPIYALRVFGKYGDLVARAEADFAGNPNSQQARRQLGMALATAGDFAGALPMLEEGWKLSGRRVTNTGSFNLDEAIALINIRRAIDEAADVNELVAALMDDVRRLQEAGFDSRWIDTKWGFAAYLAGDRDKGLQLIAKAVEGGVFFEMSDAYLQALYDDPGFAPIRTMQEARQDREREKFLSIVCADNPYAASWQPAEETCEDFVATSGR